MTSSEKSKAHLINYYHSSDWVTHSVHLQFKRDYNCLVNTQHPHDKQRTHTNQAWARVSLNQFDKFNKLENNQCVMKNIHIPEACHFVISCLPKILVCISNRKQKADNYLSVCCFVAAFRTYKIEIVHFIQHLLITYHFRSYSPSLSRVEAARATDLYIFNAFFSMVL